MAKYYNDIENCKADVGPGWAKLVTALFTLCHHHGVEIMQIKEKFGGLRFSVGGAPDWIHDIIWAVEGYSFHVCEVCGQQGEPRSPGGWIKSLCSKHYGERLAELDKRRI